MKFSEFELIFKGSDALERKGAFYTISDQDHPITKLMQYPRKVPRGTSVLLGLNIYKVFIIFVPVILQPLGEMRVYILIISL